MYFSYDWITQKMIDSPAWISTFKEMLEFFLYSVKDKSVKMIITMIISIPIPLISVFLLKSTVDYLKEDREIIPRETEKENDEISEEVLKFYDKNPERR
jgi:predicted PurR-regulated permease PerM